MEEIIIEKHNFQQSKKQIKEFSEQTFKEFQLDKVKTEGSIVVWNNHNVTGEEFNKLVSQIQKYLIEFNSFNIKFIKEFGQVYNAFESLDKDYIQAILIAIKATEKANNKIKIAQSDINDTIELQRKTIIVLKEFKDKIQSYEHLKDIDQLWDDFNKIRDDFFALNEKLNLLVIHEKNINLLLQFKDEINSHDYISNFKEVNSLKSNLQMLQRQSDEMREYFNKKLNIAYSMAGVSIVIAIVLLLFSIKSI